MDTLLSADSSSYGYEVLPLSQLWLSANLRHLCNWDKPSTLFLGSDIDFVPDYMLAHLLDLIEESGVAWTFFVTHDTPLIARMRSNPRWELALHPYHHPNSTQGSSLEEIIANLRAFCGAPMVGNRFHRFLHEYPDYRRLGALGVEHDSSILRLNLPYALPTFHRDSKVLLFTTTFEDGSFEATGDPMEVASVDITSPGVKVLSFHPLNVYLNAPTPNQRLALLQHHPVLPEIPEPVARTYRKTGLGSEHVLRGVLAAIKEREIGTATLGEANRLFREVAFQEGVAL